MSDITPQLHLWIEQIQALAKTGLAFPTDSYTRERYDAFLDLAAQMAASVNANATLDPQLADALARKYRAEVGEDVEGYVTPKVGVGAIVFNSRDELLLVHRLEGEWHFPTGWAEVGLSPAQVAAKEVREETGMFVTPLRVAGIYDSARWINIPYPHFYSIMFYCRLDGGKLAAHPVETRGAGFFATNALPSPMRRPSWVEHAWKIHKGETSGVYFDQ